MHYIISLVLRFDKKGGTQLKIQSTGMFLFYILKYIFLQVSQKVRRMLKNRKLYQNAAVLIKINTYQRANLRKNLLFNENLQDKAEAKIFFNHKCGHGHCYLIYFTKRPKIGTNISTSSKLIFRCKGANDKYLIPRRKLLFSFF